MTSPLVSNSEILYLTFQQGGTRVVEKETTINKSSKKILWVMRNIIYLGQHVLNSFNC